VERLGTASIVGALLAVFLVTMAMSSAGQTPILVKDLGSTSQINDLADIGGTLFFSGQQPASEGGEPWTSDGTAVGTYRIKDIYSGTTGSTPGHWAELGGIALFQANTLEEGQELWRSDGTEAGTYMVRDIRSGLYSGSVPVYLTPYNGAIYFQAQGDDIAQELYRTDGTYAGTYCVKDIWPGTMGSGPIHFTVAGGILFFVAYNPTYHTELWKTDGTESGTVLVKDIRSGGGSDPARLCAVGSTLFFAADDGVHGKELWKTDGTESGTVLVKDIRSGASSSGFSSPVAYGGNLYFFAFDDSGTAFWRSDGTEAGTVEVLDIYDTSFNEGYDYLTVVGDMLYFKASNGLWKSDGTPAGTEEVKHSLGGMEYPYYLTDYEGTCYFIAYDPTHGDELWRSDGTEAGTELVYDFNPGSGSGMWGSGNKLMVVGDRLYIDADYETSHAQLWMIADVSGVDTDVDAGRIEKAHLGSIRPNPFTSSATINYSLPVSSDVKIGIYDVRGRLVVSLLDGYMKEGEHSVEWNGCDGTGGKVSRGIYFCRMRAEDTTSTRKMVLAQ
jgi:ELWxxDGT repeat protein